MKDPRGPDFGRENQLSPVAGAVLRAPERPEPFPHRVLRDVWPDDLLAEIEATRPTDDQLAGLPVHGARDAAGRGLRRYADLRGLMAVHSRPWARVRALLATPELTTAVRSACGLYERSEDGRVLYDVPLDPWPVYFRDEAGYAIPWHTDDRRRKAATLLLYLPHDEGQRRAGTLLGPADVGGVVPPAFASLVPFERNTGLLFRITGNSWHSVPTLPHELAPRDMLAVLYYRATS